MNRPRRSTLTGVAVYAALLCLLSWAAYASTADGRAFDRASALWESKEPAAYSFTYFYCSGMCADCLLTVTVTGGEVIATKSPPRCPDVQPVDAPTIEDVFAQVDDDQPLWDSDLVDVAYDGAWGFPDHVEIRCPGETADCGTGYGVGNFRVLPRKPT